jgi:hypothetical protein
MLGAADANGVLQIDAPKINHDWVCLVERKE